MIDLETFDFPLDESRIARYPAAKRDESRLMVVERRTGCIRTEPFFRNIQNYLLPTDHIFFNETKVSKRRVYLSGGRGGIRTHETVFLEEESPGHWVCLVRNSRKLVPGDQLVSPSGRVVFRVLEKRDKDLVLHVDSGPIVGEDFFEREGNIPIPPYLRRKSEPIDQERYQTIFAKKSGSVAAPTAGLHISEELKDRLCQYGVGFHPLHLEIGFGTFQPLSDENLQNKTLHRERIHIPESTLRAHNSTRERGERRIALGTTTLRALEAYSRSPEKNLMLNPSEGEPVWMGETEIFLAPGDKIDTIDGLITNFHLPKSSLMLLVSAFAGVELIREAYHKALEQEFRFFSYGDAMFIV